MEKHMSKQSAAERAEEIRIRRENIRAAQKAEERRKTKKVLIPVAIAAAVLVAALIVVVILANANTEGAKLRDLKYMESEHYTVDGAMMKYWVGNYATSLAEKGTIDATKAISAQKIGGENALDLIAEAVSRTVYDNLQFAEAALACGITVSDTTKAGMNASAQTLQNVPSGVGINDIVKCLEISYLADKYKENYRNLEVTEEEVEAFRAGGEADKLLKAVDALCYTFRYDANDGSSIKTAQEYANACIVDGGYAKFFSNLVKIAARANGVSESEMEETLASGVTRGARYTDNDFGNWAFEDGRKAGDCIVMDDESAGCYCVYAIVKAPYLDDGETVSLYHIQFPTAIYGAKVACREFAQQQVDNFKKGEVSEQAFAELAKKMNFTKLERDGYCENYSPSRMPTAIAEWATKEGRTSGDYDIIDTDDGSEIVWFCGTGKPAWYADAIEQIRANKLEETLASFGDKCNVTVTEEAFDKLGL